MRKQFYQYFEQTAQEWVGPWNSVQKLISYKYTAFIETIFVQNRN
jgi:hypothetical protein